MRLIILIYLVMLSFPVMAANMEAQKIEGISLDMTMDEAVAVLESRGYKEATPSDLITKNATTDVQEKLVFKKGDITVTIVRGLLVNMTDKIAYGVEKDSDPHLLMDIAKKKQLPHSESDPTHCPFVVKAVNRFCSGDIQTENKKCESNSRVELKDREDGYNYRYEALYHHPQLCFELITRQLFLDFNAMRQ